VTNLPGESKLTAKIEPHEEELSVKAPHLPVGLFLINDIASRREAK